MPRPVATPRLPVSEFTDFERRALQILLEGAVDLNDTEQAFRILSADVTLAFKSSTLGPDHYEGISTKVLATVGTARDGAFFDMLTAAGVSLDAAFLHHQTAEYGSFPPSRTLLWFGAEIARSIDFVRALVSRGVNVNVSGKADGQMLIHSAVERFSTLSRYSSAADTQAAADAADLALVLLESDGVRLDRHPHMKSCPIMPLLADMASAAWGRHHVRAIRLVDGLIKRGAQPNPRIPVPITPGTPADSPDWTASTDCIEKSLFVRQNPYFLRWLMEIGVDVSPEALGYDLLAEAQKRYVKSDDQDETIAAITQAVMLRSAAGAGSDKAAAPNTSSPAPSAHPAQPVRSRPVVF